MERRRNGGEERRRGKGKRGREGEGNGDEKSQIARSGRKLCYEFWGTFLSKKRLVGKTLWG